jgi:hypothetical protein
MENHTVKIGIYGSDFSYSEHVQRLFSNHKNLLTDCRRLVRWVLEEYIPPSGYDWNKTLFEFMKCNQGFIIVAKDPTDLSNLVERVRTHFDDDNVPLVLVGKGGADICLPDGNYCSEIELKKILNLMLERIRGK